MRKRSSFTMQSFAPCAPIDANERCEFPRQVELVFKWTKQRLHINRFFGVWLGVSKSTFPCNSGLFFVDRGNNA